MMSFSEFRTLAAFKEASGYELEDGWVPRITKIVGIKAKPALYFYYASAPSYAAAKAQTEKSAEEGTLVHETIEQILVGKSPEVDPLIAPSIKAFEEFLSNNDIVVIPEHIEKRIVNPTHRYAGTIDALAYVNGKFGVLDVKTSQAIYRDYSLQTAAYMGAAKEDPALQKVETRWILRIDQTSECTLCGAIRRVKGGRQKIRRSRLIPCPQYQHSWSEVKGVAELQEFSGWENDFEAFLGAKKLWEWENERWLKEVGYL